MQIARIGDGSNQRYSAEVVGGKAANLAHMAALGLPVPPAFVLPVELCAAIVSGERNAMQILTEALAEGIGFLQNATGKRFGDRRRPLLVSVRSGAARVDAWNARQRAQCRLHFCGRSGSHADERQSAICMGLPAAISRKLWRGSAWS